MTHRFRSMGCEVVVAGADVDSREAVEELFSARDHTFSRFCDDSELNRVNEHAGRPIRISEEFAAMLTLALDAARDTAGLVTPTIGAALEEAGYDADFSLLTDDGRVPRSLRPSDWRRVRVVGRHVFVPHCIRLDLNGVVKGKTVDDAMALLPGDGFVSAGGDIAVRGGAVVAVPGGEAVRLVRGALATSGTDRRRWLRGGVVQHHLIDARTGCPSRARWTHVTACGATCVAADVAAKAAFVLDDNGPDWLDERRIPGRFVTSDGAVVANSSWLALVPEHVCT